MFKRQRFGALYRWFLLRIFFSFPRRSSDKKHRIGSHPQLYCSPHVFNLFSVDLFHIDHSISLWRKTFGKRFWNLYTKLFREQIKINTVDIRRYVWFSVCSKTNNLVPFNSKKESLRSWSNFYLPAVITERKALVILQVILTCNGSNRFRVQLLHF